jgi:hypothetical protein
MNTKMKTRSSTQANTETFPGQIVRAMVLWYPSANDAEGFGMPMEWPTAEDGLQFARSLMRSLDPRGEAPAGMYIGATREAVEADLERLRVMVLAGKPTDGVGLAIAFHIHWLTATKTLIPTSRRALLWTVQLDSQPGHDLISGYNPLTPGFLDFQGIEVDGSHAFMAALDERARSTQ